MLRLNRTTEYGLIALRHLAHKAKAGAASSAREVADHYGLPFDITAKTLQRLKDAGLIESAQGSRGGYKLDRELTQVSLAEFLDLMEGPQNVVACAGHEAPACEYSDRCQIDGVLRGLNAQIRDLISKVMLSQFVEAAAPAPISNSFNASLSPILTQMR